MGYVSQKTVRNMNTKDNRTQVVVCRVSHLISLRLRMSKEKQQLPQGWEKGKKGQAISSSHLETLSILSQMVNHPAK